MRAAVTSSTSGSTAAAMETKPGDGTPMPALPPKVAKSSGATPASPDEAHDSYGEAPLDDGTAKDKESSKQTAKTRGHTTASGSTATSLSKVKRQPGAKSRGASGREKDRESTASASSAASTATTAVLQQLLREKDERIAELERERRTMQDEFHRELDHLSTAESETATFWQGKFSDLNQRFLLADTELRLLRNEREVREAERDELRRGWEAMRREALERDNEVRRLRGQVRGLKEFVSTSTRTEEQTCDEDLAEAAARLGNGLQNWVIVHFRKVKLDLSKTDEATLAELNELVPMYEELVPTAKVHLLQSIVSRVLIETIFGAYYVGLSDAQTTQLRQIEGLLSQFVALSDEPLNQWRSSTLVMLRREGPDLLQEQTSHTIDAVVARVNRLLEAITPPAPAPSSTSTTASSSPPTTTAGAALRPSDATLRALVSSAVDLSRLMVVQKAAVRAWMPHVLPHQRVLFDPATMEDVGGEEDDEEALATREISCVVFPAVIKRGDEAGAQLQSLRNVLAKARVLCRPEE